MKTRYESATNSLNNGNLLCELILLESERHELLAAYEVQRVSGQYPSMGLQIFAHNVKHHTGVAVYVAHAAEILGFAHKHSLQWLEDAVVTAYRRLKDSKVAVSLRRDEPLSGDRPTDNATLPDHMHTSRLISQSEMATEKEPTPGVLTSTGVGKSNRSSMEQPESDILSQCSLSTLQSPGRQ
jgi:hypothetical protein